MFGEQLFFDWLGFLNGDFFHVIWAKSVWVIRLGVALGISMLALIQSDWKPLSVHPKLQKLKGSETADLLGLMAILLGILWVLSGVLLIGLLPNLLIILTGAWVSKKELVRLKLLREVTSQKVAPYGRLLAVACLVIQLTHLMTQNRWLII